jgi:TRAP-type C4-dicarboxylate transport system permease small subunit
MSSFFNRALKGAIEISSVCYAAAVYLGLPSVQRLSQHIGVDIVTTKLPPRLQTACKIFGITCTFVFLTFLSTRVWIYAMASLARFERDSGVLMFPAYPFKLLALLGLIGCTLEAGRQLLELILPKQECVIEGGKRG